MSKKSMIIAGSSIVAVLVLLILIVWLLSVFKKSYTTYEKVEEKMVNAANKYYKTYPELLPVNEGKYTLQYSALVEGEFIKPLNELLKDGDSCTAEVNVYKDGDNYDYIPKINCGTNYQTLELFQKIINENPVVTTGSGLYQNEDGSLYFRGKIDNNYVILGRTGTGRRERDIVWRILGIDANGNIQMVSETSFNDKVAFDNRYNIKEGKYTGYNDYIDSVLKDYLVRMNNTEEFLKENEKQKLVKMPICYGKRKTTDTVNDGSIECKEKSDPLYFGTITPYEFIRASLDENCNKVYDKSCGNFNYLYNNAISKWTVTSTTENTFQSYLLTGASFELTKASSTKAVYPTAYISARVLYRTGTGTLEDPYKIVTN